MRVTTNLKEVVLSVISLTRIFTLSIAVFIDQMSRFSKTECHDRVCLALFRIREVPDPNLGMNPD